MKPGSLQWVNNDALQRGLLSEGSSNIMVLPRARLSDSKDRRCENKVWLDLEKGAVVEQEEKSFFSLQLSLSALLSLSLSQAISTKS